MSRSGILAALLLTITVGIILWWIEPWEESSSVPRSGRYLCATGDTLEIASANSRLVVTSADGRIDTLARREAESGTWFANATETVGVWAKNNMVQYQRNSQVRAYGCQATSSAPRDSLRAVEPWFRAPTRLNDYGFTVQIPRSIDVSQPKPNITQFLFAGPANDPPALTDGFTVTVRLVAIGPDTTLQQFVNRTIRQTERVGGTMLAPVRDTVLQTRDARYWRQESVMGDAVTHFAVTLDPRTLALISTSIIGAQTDVYEQTIDAMLSTLQFRARPAPLPTDSMSVPLAFLADPEGPPERGCDDVVFLDRSIVQSNNRLSTALDTLFAIDHDSIDGTRHFLTQTNETLHFDRAVVDDDTARVYLSGRLTGLRGVCDNPRARIQIEETARRVSGVPQVVLYLNGERTTLQPSGRKSD